MPRRRRPSLPRLLLYLVGVAVVVLGLSQLLLPRIAESRIRSRLDPYGQVHGVKVSAWPAIELLWGDADSVRVQAGSLALSTARAATLLHEAKGISRISFASPSVRLGKLRITNATLLAREDRFSAAGLVSAADVRSALPPGVTLQLLGSDAGRVTVRAGGSLFGVGGALDAVAEASSGRIVVHPAGLLLGGVRLPLFSDPRVYVLGVSARAVRALPPTYRVGLAALLR